MTSGTENQFIPLVLDWAIGLQNIRQFREDLKEIMIKKSEKLQRWHTDPKDLQRQGLEAAKDARKSRWDKIGFWFGVLGALTFFHPIVPTIATFAGILVSLITGIRRAAVEILLYENPYQLRHPDNIKFACAWNRAMNGWTSLFVIPVGMFVVRTPDAYRLALWIIVDYAEEKSKSKTGSTTY